MKSRLLIISLIALLPLFGFVGLVYAHHDGTVHPTPNVEMAQEEFTLATLEWGQLNYRMDNGTDTAKIIVTDPDMNKISSYIDTLNVSVYSDSFQKGIILKLYETEKNSGIFERTFTLSENRSAPSVLYVQFGDTATVTYADTALPLDNEFSEIILMKTTLIGPTGPPLERVPASNVRIMDIFGNIINMLNVHDQVLIYSDITNQQNYEQKFVWILQIINHKKEIVSLAWIDGILNPEVSFDVSMSWIPENEGQYVATIFVWESLDNPSALSPPISVDIIVSPEDAIPIDFTFKYSFGIDEKNLFDSKEDLYVADMICDPSIKLDVHLSKEEKQIIWKSVTANNFFELDDFTNTCDVFGNCVLVEPEEKITLSVTANRVNHSVHYRETYMGNTDQNLESFNNIIQTIQEILDSKNEIKNLLVPKCGYM